MCSEFQTTKSETHFVLPILPQPKPRRPLHSVHGFLFLPRVKQNLRLGHDPCEAPGTVRPPPPVLGQPPRTLKRLMHYRVESLNRFVKTMRKEKDVCMVKRSGWHRKSSVKVAEPTTDLARKPTYQQDHTLKGHQKKKKKSLLKKNYPMLIISSPGYK